MPDDGLTGGNFGSNVAVSGNTMAVGSTRSVTGAPPMGAVYVYERGSSGWEFKQRLDPHDCLYMTGGVAVSSEFIAAKCSIDEPIQVFRRIDGDWQHFQSLSRSNALHDAFPTEIAMSDRWLVASAPQSTHSGKQTGSLVVYEFNGTNWDEDVELIPSDLTYWNLQWIGQKIDMTSNYIVARTRKNRVIVWSLLGSTWTWITSLYVDAVNYPVDVAVSTEGVIAASSEEEVTGLGTGAVYVWRPTSPINWTQDAILHPLSSYGDFGQPMVFTNDLLLVGSGVTGGVFRLYYEYSGNWYEEPMLPSLYGRALDGDENTWVVGNPTLNGTGSAELFDFFAFNGGVFLDGFEWGDTSAWASTTP